MKACNVLSIYSLFFVFLGHYLWLTASKNTENTHKFAQNCIYNVQKLFAGGGRKKGRGKTWEWGVAPWLLGDRRPWLWLTCLVVAMQLYDSEVHGRWKLAGPEIMADCRWNRRRTLSDAEVSPATELVARRPPNGFWPVEGSKVNASACLTACHHAAADAAARSMQSGHHLRRPLSKQSLQMTAVADCRRCN